MTETYPMPAHGWTCFHCGDTFTSIGAAEIHFGKTPLETAGCILKVRRGAEHASLFDLRKLQEENERLRTEINENIWNDKAFYAHLELILHSYKPFRNCRTIQDVFNVYDSMEGRAISAEERLTSVSSVLGEI